MKRIISLLLALVIAISAAVPAYATGDGNFDGGGGSMGDGTKTNYWNPGMDGVRVSIVDVGSHSVVRTPIDLTNKVPIANVAHFGKVSKLSYNAGRGLSVSVSGYSYRNPSQSLPKIISTGSSKASIAAIRSYFTDEQVIRSIAGYAGMDFDTLIGGDYKLVVEPLAYLCYNGQQFAMTATEAALYDQIVNGDLRKKLGTLTHKNLPLAIFLEEADLGYTAWPGSRTEKASNGDIISSLGIGIVRFNEVIASGIMERLGIPHVSYTVIWSKDAPYSVCEDFVTENTELIPAWRLLQAKKQKNSTSRYRHLLECCELLGIGNITPFLDRMLVLDYIIANEDRHFNNFGALRNAETLEWLGMAPIYDSGSSLGYDKMPGQMRSEKDVICKPFKNHHAEQLKLVTDFDWIDFDRLSDVDELISSVLSCEEAADYIDEGRIHAITESVQRRIGHLQELAMTQTPRQLDTTEDDVREEVAADYAPKMEL